MGKYNLWLEWEAYKMRHPEIRQVLEWQEQDYSPFCGVARKMVVKKGKTKMAEVKCDWEVIEVGDGYVVARNGLYGVPAIVDHYYAEKGDAQEVADRLNGHAGISEATRFD